MQKSKKIILHYIILGCIILLAIFHIKMLIHLSVPIEDKALSEGVDFTILYYLKFTSTHILYLLFGLIGTLLLAFGNRKGVFFSILFVLYLLINNLFVVKSDWIYIAQSILFILFFSLVFYFKSYKDYGLEQNKFRNYIYIILLICLTEYTPLLISHLAM